mmetsp:Transcript_2091/g.6187  ORF Transcript_2091/g.6187 Transcript_2091/m.6187 type:complete len:321 (+) Transcript_2091:155-1117(+)|eukprot:CAMPEP_0206148800 /NCGR_PEP_ID=MMETSP1473-20131121/37442_1 /ASSEMBLY_ACC=CAM_ASM_001109 /TAXON_ID=1461547 /ORGANISM="Stichococcus sp, Strain RCC1054" /LENGTH=320 /DNA_ID=CAMNT_0053546223 /DNA_START=511 /DNA_END=1473 /DNA_ORIENTATION=-
MGEVRKSRKQQLAGVKAALKKKQQIHKQLPPQDIEVLRAEGYDVTNIPTFGGDGGAKSGEPASEEAPMDTSGDGDKPAQGGTKDQPGSDEAPMDNDSGGEAPAKAAATEDLLGSKEVPRDNISSKSHEVEGGVADPDKPSDVVPTEGPTAEDEAAPGDHAVAKEGPTTGGEAAPTPGDAGSGGGSGTEIPSGRAASGEGEAPAAGEEPQGDKPTAEEAPGGKGGSEQVQGFVVTESAAVKGGVADPDNPSDVAPVSGPTAAEEAAAAYGGADKGPTPGDEHKHRVMGGIKAALARGQKPHQEITDDMKQQLQKEGYDVPS